MAGNGQTTEITLPIEAITWHDAAKTFRQPFNPSHVILITIGFRLYEDAREVVLFTEIQKAVGYASSNVDATQIPKKGIIERRVIGEYTFSPGPATPKKRVRNKKTVAKVVSEGTVTQIQGVADGGNSN